MRNRSVPTLCAAALAAMIAFSTVRAEEAGTEAEGAGEGVVAIAFTGPGFTGLAWKITETGSYDLWEGFDLPNDSICSLKVKPGYRVVLFEDSDFGGEELAVSGDRPGLPRDWMRKASSLVVEAHPDYVAEWVAAAEEVGDFTGSQTLPEDFDREELRKKAEPFKERITFFLESSKDEWYGSTTDAERVAMAGEILDLFVLFGFDVSRWTPDTLAQHMNNLYDWRSGQNILETAAMVVRIDGRR